MVAVFLKLTIRFLFMTNKSPVPTKRATVSLINVKSSNELLCMLVVCIYSICLKVCYGEVFGDKGTMYIRVTVY